MSGRRIVYGALGIVLALVAGCATGNRKVTVLYQPVVHDGTGSGELYLAGAPASGRDDIQWVIGKVKNGDGQVMGDVTSPISPVELATDAFRQELTAAGYTVKSVGALPPQAAKGIVVSGTDIHVVETSSLVKGEVSSRVQVSVELWKNGSAFKKLTYESRLSDFGIRDREFLVESTLKKGLQEIMGSTVPEIVAAFEH